MSLHPFDQVDVFSAVPLKGNPLAVVHGADGLSEETMAAFARWTNLSETTFLLSPTDPAADYRVRIFTPGGELPFAGHPTLGTCWAWLAAGGRPRAAADPGVVVQQCGVGLVRVRRDAGHASRLAFAAPPTRRSGPLEEQVLERIVRALRLPAGAVRAHQWVDNGPGWAGVLLDSAERVLALHPDWPALGDLKLGVVGPHAAGAEPAFELRAFIGGGMYEDPVTGSLNASVAQWLMRTGVARDAYVAAQGAALRRAGRVFLRREGEDIWVGGDVVRCVQGELSL
ncbi:MAG: PhzF family phenazine biosynthesis protein [Burkholderiales bacterium]|nr:PhzF family phenazine biosynthesis protein [Burkholderiales bacterium]